MQPLFCTIQMNLTQNWPWSLYENSNTLKLNHTPVTGSANLVLNLLLYLIHFPLLPWCQRVYIDPRAKCVLYSDPAKHFLSFWVTSWCCYQLDRTEDHKTEPNGFPSLFSYCLDNKYSHEEERTHTNGWYQRAVL